MESYISSLTMKLHIMSQDYTDQLETAMVKASFVLIFDYLILKFTIKYNIIIGRVHGHNATNFGRNK